MFNSVLNNESSEWQSDVMFARMLFLCIFEHFMFILVSALHFMIPNVPENISRQIEREKLLSLRAVWDVKRKIKKKESDQKTANGDELSLKSDAVSHNTPRHSEDSLRDRF